MTNEFDSNNPELVHKNITVNSHIHKQFKHIVSLRYSNVSTEIRKFEKSFVDEYNRTQDTPMDKYPIGIIANGERRITLPNTINENLDKYIGEFREIRHDDRILDYRTVSTKMKEGYLLLDSFIMTRDQANKRIQHDKQLYGQTDSARFEEENRRLKAEIERLKGKSSSFVNLSTSNNIVPMEQLIGGPRKQKKTNDDILDESKDDISEAN